MRGYYAHFVQPGTLSPRPIDLGSGSSHHADRIGPVGSPWVRGREVRQGLGGFFVVFPRNTSVLDGRQRRRPWEDLGRQGRIALQMGRMYHGGCCQQACGDDRGGGHLGSGSRCKGRLSTGRRASVDNATCAKVKGFHTSPFRDHCGYTQHKQPIYCSTYCYIRDIQQLSSMRFPATTGSTETS